MDTTALDEMLNRVVDDRYRLDSLIGASELSAVFAAHDTLLQRWVAIKVFDERLHDDEEFVERLFVGVAEAALINHPNIVQIYDWGVEHGPYIVTELCEGGSLAAMLEAGYRLTPSQALVVALECARGLHQAHSQGLVHRNLRPTNILFANDQRVRLVDLGLARAFADSPISKVTTALDSVRYASPEQARGRPVGAPSDLYSLALVINESVGSHRPVVGETVVGTLMERADSPAELGPELEALLGPIERCGRVEADERPEAEELTIALLAAAETMSRPSGLPLVGLDLADLSSFGESSLDDAFAALDDSIDAIDSSDPADFSGVIDLPTDASLSAGEPTAEVAIPRLVGVDDLGIDDLGVDDLGVDADGMAAHDGDISVVVPGLEGFAPTLDGEFVDAGVDHLDPDLDGPHGIDGDDGGRTIEPIDEDPFDASILGPLDDFGDFAEDDFADEEFADDELDGETPDNVVPMPQPAAVGTLENLAEAAPVFAAQPDEVPASTLDVPERSATARASRAAYEEFEDDADDVLPWWPLALLGLLIAGVIAAGVYFVGLSGAVDTATVPDVVGLTFEELDTALEDNEWEVERLEARQNGSQVGTIIAQSPDIGFELSDGGTLAVTVSLGEEMVDIPSDIVGLSVEQAESRLGAVGLVLGDVVEENNEALGAGLIIGLDEPTTQKPMGQTVSVRVSRGPEDRIVPDGIIGLTIGDATTILTGLRLLAVEQVAYSPDIPAGIVLDLSPASGETVPANSALTLIVSDGPEPVIMPDIVGLPLDEAIDAVEELGLIWVDTEGAPGENAIGSLPPVGATVEVGTEVTVILDDSPDEDDES